MNYSFINQQTPQKNYLPDSVWSLCLQGDSQSQLSNVCQQIAQNQIYSPVVQGMVTDTLRGKTWAPFGMGNSSQRSIQGDQEYLYNQRPSDYTTTTWGRAPQLSPRPLARIGQEFRTA